MSKKKFSGNISGKGYYIALILCAVAIGISGYLYSKNVNPGEPSLQTTPSESTVDIQAVATQPGDNDGDNTATVATGKTLQTVSPVAGETISVYAMDCLSYNQTTRDWRTHDGIDIAADAGTKVCSAAVGTVYTVYEDETMGTTVVIRHENGYTTCYASLSEEVSVKPGEAVQMGQTIGTVGQTALLENAIGDHVHFSVTCNGKSVNPADFLPQE